MRRALLIAALTLLFADASGISALVIPEQCAIGASDSSPDSGCPAFCVRCACACCASSVVHQAPVDLVAEFRAPGAVAVPAADRLSPGSAFDILHVPKPLLT